MKIGILISSITQSIPYITYLVSHGYDVFPILLYGNLNCIDKTNSELKNLIEKIASKVILDGDFLSEVDKLDCLIVLENSKETHSFENINYNGFLKDNAPIIVNAQQSLAGDCKSEVIV